MTRFIHAADIHLDSPLTGLSRYEGAPLARLRNATREAFVALVARAVEEKVDFVVIAGDLYDGSWKDANTGLFFAAQMGRLRQAGIRCVILHGNHDAASEITRTLSLPDNVHVFGHRRAETIAFEDLRVALHGQSFKQPATTESLHQNYPEPSAGWLNIGVLHTALEGHADHARYAPCSLQALVTKGYHYWALGHVHERKILNERPWIVFPGNLQGRHARETGARGAVLVTTEGSEISAVESFDCDVLRWQILRIAVDGMDEREVLLAAVDGAMSSACDAADRPLAARIELRGRTLLHGGLALGQKSLRDDVLSRANGLGEDRIWIEKIRLVTAPLLSADEIAAREDALADLGAMLAKAPEDAELLGDLKRELQALRETLPQDLRDPHLLPDLHDLDDSRIAELIRSSGNALIDRLARG